MADACLVLQLTIKDDFEICRYYDKFIARCIRHAQQYKRQRPLLGTHSHSLHMSVHTPYWTFRPLCGTGSSANAVCQIMISKMQM